MVWGKVTSTGVAPRNLIFSMVFWSTFATSGEHPEPKYSFGRPTFNPLRSGSAMPFRAALT